MAQISQNTRSADDEGIQLTYSSLLPGRRPHAPPAVLPDDGEPEPGSVQASWGVWPQPYRRVLTGAFVSAMFALGVLLGTVVSGPVVSLNSMPSPLPMLSHPGGTTTPATQLGAVGSRPLPATLDARFAIVTLGIECLSDTCDGSPYVSAGQHINALRGGWSCTTLSAAEVMSHHDQYIYCRLNQPSVFTATFDGAPFECVGSRLGCHFIARVETTNGR